MELLPTKKANNNNMNALRAHTQKCVCCCCFSEFFFPLCHFTINWPYFYIFCNSSILRSIPMLTSTWKYILCHINENATTELKNEEKKPIQHKNIKNSTRHKDKAVGSGNEMKIIGNIWKINFFCAFWCTWMRIASMHRLKYYNTVYRISLNCGIHWAHAQFYSTHTRYEVWWIIWWFVQVSPFMVFSDSLRLNTLREFVKPRISTSLFL